VKKLPGKRIGTLLSLKKAALNKKAVCSINESKEKSRVLPAMFVLNMSGWVIQTWFENGMYVLRGKK